MITRYQKKVMVFPLSWAAVCLLALCRAAPVSAEISADRLFKICHEGTVEELAEAIAAGADVNARGDQEATPVMMAAFEETGASAAKARLLLEAGADQNLTDALGSNALIYAASRCNAEVMTLLLDAGADLDYADVTGDTALVSVFNQPERWEKGSLETALRVLIERGADFDAGRAAWTPIIVLAGPQADPAVIGLLLESGSRVNESSHTGVTALMTAAESNSDPAVVAALLAAGADAGLIDQKERTALDYARNNKTPAAGEIIKLLEAAQK